MLDDLSAAGIMMRDSVLEKAASICDDRYNELMQMRLQEDTGERRGASMEAIFLAGCIRALKRKEI